jgi:hypothetical protein
MVGAALPCIDPDQNAVDPQLFSSLVRSPLKLSPSKPI